MKTYTFDLIINGLLGPEYKVVTVVNNYGTPNAGAVRMQVWDCGWVDL